MITRTIYFIILVLLLASCQQPESRNNSGSLVIVGGALSKDNAEVFNSFIQLAGGNEKAVIGIIPAASEKPVTYANNFKRSLIDFGFPEKQVFIIPIALRNDPSTAEDESLWIQNSFDNETIALIRQCSGIWFSGGDQTRIVKCLLGNDGEATPALEAVWEVYEKGGVIGGTSAGAAVMSSNMIAAGSSLEALMFGKSDTYESIGHQEEGPLYIARGLGFFKGGIIDQHFDRKARIGRLVMATFETKDEGLLGFGIDENTALLVSNNGDKLRAIGRGGVTIVDASAAESGKIGDGRSWYKKVGISFIEAGDEFCFSTKEVLPNPQKVLTNGNEYFNITNPYSNGSLSPYGQFKHQLTYLLVDNASISELKSHTFMPNGKGFEVTLRKTNKTKGFWAYFGDEIDRYTVVNAEMDIVPVTVKIESNN